MFKADGFLLQDTKNLNYTHTLEDILKNSGGCFYFIQQKKKTAATSHLTTEQKLTFTLCHWNDDWHSGAVRLEDASDTCTLIHTYSPGQPPMHTHLHFSFTSAILHIYGCSCSNRITAPPLRCIQSERRGVKGHPQIRLPCFCLSSQANSGTRGDITQRPQPYVSVVHRRSNMTPQQ